MGMPGLYSYYTHAYYRMHFMNCQELSFFKRSTDRTLFTLVIAGVHSYIDDDVLEVISYAMTKTIIMQNVFYF